MNQVCNTVMIPVEEYESLRKQVVKWESIYATLCCEKAEAVCQLAAMTQERDEWKREFKASYKRETEAQAREQRLREALERCAYRPQSPEYHRIQIALALPQDDTALKAYGAKLLRDAAEIADKESETGEGGWKLLRMAEECTNTSTYGCMPTMTIEVVLTPNAEIRGGEAVPLD